MLICQANSLALNQVQSYEIILLLGLFQKFFLHDCEIDSFDV